MLKKIFLRGMHMLTILVLAWALSGADLQIVQANINPSSSLAPTAGSIFIPMVGNGSGASGNPSPGGTDPVIFAAGDIARCGDTGYLKTAAIIKKVPGATVLPLGDNAYESGALSEYNTCYDPAWGAFKDRTKPVPGNHEYLTAGAAGYFSYFGAAAGSPGKGYYSYDLGAWHILAINSNCGDAGGCGTGSPQEKWVRKDLAATNAKCVLAYWHQPYYSAVGKGGASAAPGMGTIFEDLYKANAEIVLSGHIHAYERFAPQDDTARVDLARGIVQFVVGTGGSNFTSLQAPLAPNTLVSQDTVFGVLKLTLHPTSYTWQFVPISGKFTDTGTANCH